VHAAADGERDGGSDGQLRTARPLQTERQRVEVFGDLPEVAAVAVDKRDLLFLLRLARVGNQLVQPACEGVFILLEKLSPVRNACCPQEFLALPASLVSVAFFAFGVARGADGQQVAVG